MKNKKIAFLTAAAVFFSTVFGGVQAFAASSALSITVPDSVEVGETFTVGVDFSTSDVVAGGEFTLVYDNTLLQADSVAIASDLSAYGVFSAVNAAYSSNECFFTFANGTNMNFNGTLAEFTFTALASGTADFSINVCSFSDYDLVDLDMTTGTASLTIASAAEENPYVFVVDRDVTSGYESGAEIYSDENIVYKAEQTLLLNEGTSESVIGEYTYVNSLKSNGEGTTAVVDGTSKTWRIHSSITAVQGTTVTVATKAPSGKLYAFAVGSIAEGFTSIVYYDGTAVTGEVEVTLDIPAGETIYIMGQGTNPEIYAINAVYNASVTTTTESTTETTTVTTTESTTETTTATTAETTTAAPTTATTTTAAADDETETTTEEAAETTTKKSSSGGGGGGSSHYVSGTTSTTESTAEDDEDTEETTTVKTETQTEATTETSKNDIKISIGSNEIVIGDNSFEIDAAPYIQAESSSTLVPLRFAAIAILGGNIEDSDTSDIISWDAVTKTAFISIGDNTIAFTAGSEYMTVNGTERVMSNGVKAEITDGRMFIPFRALGEALGVKVDWDANTKTAIYEAK
ncbi:MAG: hypothetical protein LUG66_03295 [Clostridiales bacterium]|nr:hypothetical protein [Clostridiales bacterium]